MIELDRRQLAGPLPLPRQPRRHLRPAHDVLLAPRSSGSRSGRTAARSRRIRRATRQFNPVDFVDELEDADAGRPRRSRTSASRYDAGHRAPSPRCSGAGSTAELLLFPDENHWVLKPANSVQWYQTVLAWLDAHLSISAGARTARGAASPRRGGSGRRRAKACGLRTAASWLPAAGCCGTASGHARGELIAQLRSR